ncbi:MAG TPA: alkaline phosphatase family protein [Actinomycetota bacterium]|nr:alkaline phosphatase family protein [Actinomycetota bacterium]
MRRRTKLGVGLTTALLTALVLTPAIGGSPAAAVDPATPSRVLLLVIDGMRADYLDRYDLPNLEALRASGVGFSRSQVGYMSSITVISHNVIASGQLPKHQGWSNEIFRDTENALGGGAGGLYVMSSAACDDFRLLTTHEGYPKLADYLDALETDGDARFVSIATKDRSACGVGQPVANGSNDMIVGMARLSAPGVTCDGILHRWRVPRGANIPTGPGDIGEECGRWYVNSTLDYGTLSTSPAWLYPLDGNRFVTGFDPVRKGGDVWSTDAALKVMRDDFSDADEDDWRGLFVGLAGPDKMAHMWGPDDDVTGPTATDAMIHLPGALATVDEQVGRLLDELEAEGILDDTLIVVTADHGMTEAESFHGRPGVANVTGQGDLNWYFGAETGSRADESYVSPSPAIAALGQRIGSNLAFSYQDTHVAVWLKSGTKAQRSAAAVAMRQLPDAIATYRLNGAMDGYVRDWVSPTMASSERSWFNRNAQRLINTMASPNNADAVALLANDVTYSVQGDHGGHQRDNQMIPIFFSGPGVPSGVTSDVPIGNVDILPTILELLGVAPTAPLDGVAFDLRAA